MGIWRNYSKESANYKAITQIETNTGKRRLSTGAPCLVSPDMVPWLCAQSSGLVMTTMSGIARRMWEMTGLGPPGTPFGFLLLLSVVIWKLRRSIMLQVYRLYTWASHHTYRLVVIARL